MATDAEATLRKAIDEWLTALKAKDLDGLMSHYAPDVVVFNLATPLAYNGLDAARENWRQWFTSWEPPLQYEMHDLTIAADGDVAVSHSLNHIAGKDSKGKEMDIWIRVTVGFRRSGGRWLTTHEHVSVPFDMENGQARLDLKP
jgi:uncharacterized protein (TIGR02246 family)